MWQDIADFLFTITMILFILCIMYMILEYVHSY
jgi:hypothetical protein